MRRTLTATTALAAALGLSACAVRHAQPLAQPPPRVETAVAAVGSVAPTLTLPGIIAPLQNVALSTTLTEPADAVYVQEGDHVRKGQVLALLDTADLRANLESLIRTAQSDQAKVAQAKYSAQLSIGQGTNAVQSARAALAQAQKTLNNDQANLQRDRELLANGFIAQQTVDQQATQVANDSAAVQNAEANLRSAILNEQVNGSDNNGLQAANIAAARTAEQAAYAQADQVRTQIAKATIVSPVDGVVVNRNLNPGEYPGNRQIFTIQELDHVYAILNATTVQAFEARPGAPVTLTIQGQPQTFTGRVVAVLDQLIPGSTNFAIKVDVPNPRGLLHSGMPVTGVIALPAARGITIPTTAFLDDTHSSVLAVGSDGVTHAVHVRELRSDGRRSIVRGLSPGTEVVANGQAGVADGEHVTVAQAGSL
jgi:HlyD family secretion protein